MLIAVILESVAIATTVATMAPIPSAQAGIRIEITGSITCVMAVEMIGQGRKSYSKRISLE